MVKEYTNRGFSIYDEVTDTKGNTVRIQESSSAEQPCVWMFNDIGDAHINVEQAKQVINALQEFVDDYED